MANTYAINQMIDTLRTVEPININLKHNARRARRESDSQKMLRYECEEYIRALVDWMQEFYPATPITEKSIKHAALHPDGDKTAEREYLKKFGKKLFAECARKYARA